jgi:protoporphyrinogen oxidase
MTLLIMNGKDNDLEPAHQENPLGQSNLPSEPAPIFYDAIVLGAGISGLVASSILSEDPSTRVLIADGYPTAGGNHISVNIGDYTFDIGSYIFQDDSPLLKHFPELLPDYIKIDPSWRRLNPQGRVTKYPVSIKDDVVAAGPLEWTRIGLSVVFARLFRRDWHNARDFARYWIGARFLKRSGLENYMERFYGLPPERIDLHFAEKRMSWIREYASLDNPMFKRRMTPDTSPPNCQLARPKAGFPHLYDIATHRLQKDGVDFSLGVDLKSIERIDDGFVVRTPKGTFAAKRLISTLPLPMTLALCGVPFEKPLDTVTLISLFYSFSGERGFDSSILYNFSYDGPWKRLTVYSDFYGLSNGREYFAVEVNADHVDGSVEQGDGQFRAHTQKNGLFSGDLVLEGSHVLQNAYPIYVHGATEAAAEAISALRAFGVESIGRQGKFDYQPTARDTTLKAEMALADSGLVR